MIVRIIYFYSQRMQRNYTEKIEIEESNKKD